MRLCAVPLGEISCKPSGFQGGHFSNLKMSPSGRSAIIVTIAPKRLEFVGNGNDSEKNKKVR